MTGSLPPWGREWETTLPFLISEPDRRCHPERARGTRASEGSGMRSRGTRVSEGTGMRPRETRSKGRIWYGQRPAPSRAHDLPTLPDLGTNARAYRDPIQRFVRGSG